MMRIFVARSAFVPAAWLDALDEPRHIRQLDLTLPAAYNCPACRAETRGHSVWLGPHAGHRRIRICPPHLRTYRLRGRL
jgi:hypothetical protein